MAIGINELLEGNQQWVQKTNQETNDCSFHMKNSQNTGPLSKTLQNPSQIM